MTSFPFGHLARHPELAAVPDEPPPVFVPADRPGRRPLIARACPAG
ncbi:hypothetical protein [Nonomuraea longispora]|nr:hypothetical protein [Nonomuraea longispora]